MHFLLVFIHLKIIQKFYLINGNQMLLVRCSIYKERAYKDSPHGPRKSWNKSTMRTLPG